MTTPEKPSFYPVEEVQPIPVQEIGSFTPTGAEKLQSRLLYDVHQAFSDKLLDPNLTTEELPDYFAEVTNQVDMDGLIQDALRSGLRYGMGDKVLELYGLSHMVDTYNLPGVAIGHIYVGPFPAKAPTGFKEDIVEQLRNLDPAPLEPIIDMQRTFEERGLLDVFRSIDDAIKHPDETQEFPGDKIYEIVRAFADDPEAGLHSIEVDSAYLMCFISPTIRRLTKDIMIAQLMEQGIRTELERDGNTVSDTEEQAVGAIVAMGKLSGLSGQPWDELHERTAPMSEEARIRMAYTSAERGSAASLLVETMQDPTTAERIYDAYTKAREQLAEALRQVWLNHGDSISWLENSDFGHAMNNFMDMGVIYVLQAHDYLAAERIKGDKHAVILEDDREQAQYWAKQVREASTYNLDESNIYHTPEDVVEAVDSSVGLVVLDIQNYEDEFAGLHVAQAVVQKRLVDYDNGSGEPLHIVVWSTSPAHVRSAERVLKDSFESNPDVSIGGSSRKITIACRTKGFITGSGFWADM